MSRGRPPLSFDGSSTKNSTEPPSTSTGSDAWRWPRPGMSSVAPCLDRLAVGVVDVDAQRDVRAAEVHRADVRAPAEAGDVADAVGDGADPVAAEILQAGPDAGDGLSVRAALHVVVGVGRDQKRPRQHVVRHLRIVLGERGDEQRARSALDAEEIVEDVVRQHGPIRRNGERLLDRRCRRRSAET